MYSKSCRNRTKSSRNRAESSIQIVSSRDMRGSRRNRMVSSRNRTGNSRKGWRAAGRGYGVAEKESEAARTGKGRTFLHGRVMNPLKNITAETYEFVTLNFLFYMFLTHNTVH